MLHDIRVHVPWELAAPLAVLDYAAAVMERVALHQLVPLPPLPPMAGATGETWPSGVGSRLREEAEMAA